MTSETTKPSAQEKLPPRPQLIPETNKLTSQDITDALKAGFNDFLSNPFMSGFFGLFYAAFGILFVWCLAWLGKIWMIIPASVGFPLVAPFAAAGLYEISRRRQTGQNITWPAILSVMARQRKRDGLCDAVHLLGLGLPSPPLACDHPTRRVFL